MSHEPDISNPYAAPSAGAELGAGRAFAFSDELRQLMSSTATLMIIAGVLQMIPGVLTLIVVGFSATTALVVTLFGVVPAFTAIAGILLRPLAKPGDDLNALHSGIRVLLIPFVVKGGVMLLVVGLTVLSFVLSLLQVGAGFAAMWD